MVVQRAIAENPRGSAEADHRSSHGRGRACRRDGGACRRRLKIGSKNHGLPERGLFPHRTTPECDQKDSALSFCVRREEAHHVVVIECQTTGSEVLSVGGKIEFASENAGFQLSGSVSSISEASQNLLQIREEKYVDRGVRRDLLLQSKIPGFVAEVASLQKF